MGKTILFILVWGLSSLALAHGNHNEGQTQPQAQGNVVEFRISAGTGDNSWNTPETAVEARVGDTLRIINDDSVDHQLHITAGAPCPHGDNMSPGQSWECVVAKPYDPETGFKMYDHHRGESSRFYFKTIP